MGRLTTKPVPGDWNGTLNAIAKLDSELNSGAAPTFAGLTISGLAASRLAATDASKVLASVSDLTTWITGTANQVVVADDSDGTITLSLPQDIHTGAVPTFSGLIPAADATYDFGKSEIGSGGLEISQEVYGGLNEEVTSTSWRGNTFTTVDGFTLEKVTLRLERYSGPPVTITLHITATSAGKPTGADLATKQVDIAAITTDDAGELVDFVLDSPLVLSSATMYAWYCTNATGNVRLVGSNSNQYAGGTHIWSNDSGSSWGITVEREHVFYLYSQSSIIYTRWQDLYLSGVLHDGTVSLSVANAKAAYDFTTALNAATDGQLMIGSTGANPVLATLTGTANQITVTGGAGSITLSTPQDIHAAATPTFASLSLGTGELTAGSINRAADTLTLEIAGTPELSISANLVAIANGLTVDTDTLVVDADNNRVGIGTASSSQKLTIGSNDGSDKIEIYHNNTHAYIRWDDGDLTLRTIETGDKKGVVNIKGNGNREGALRVYNGAGNGFITFNPYGTRGYLDVVNSMNDLTLQSLGDKPVKVFTESTEGTTQEFQIYGFRTGDGSVRKKLEIGVGVDADDTASFDGLSNYWFDGIIQSTGGAQLGDGGVTNYMGITATGGVVFVGGAGLAFAEINVVSNAVETVIASAGAAVQITIFNTNGPSNNVTPDHTNDHITITKAGIYLITVSSTVNSVTGAASRLEMTVLKNNGTALIGALHCDRDVGGGGSESGSVSISGLADLSVDDTIEVWIENETNTQNYVVEDITLTLVQVGGN